jgi:hypothetical protein
MVMTLAQEQLVHETAVHHIEPVHLAHGVPYLFVIKQTMGREKDLLQPTPLRVTHHSRADPLQLRRVRPAILVQDVLDGARSSTTPAVQRDVRLKDAVALLPAEDDKGACHEITAIRQSEWRGMSVRILETSTPPSLAVVDGRITVHDNEPTASKTTEISRVHRT